MIVFTLTTMRLFLPFDLAPYPAILATCSESAGATPISGQCERATLTWLSS